MTQETTSEIEHHIKPPHHVGISMGARLRGYFIAGILVTAPISITLYLTYSFLTFIDRRVADILPSTLYHSYSGTAIPGIGLLIAVSFFMFVGWFARNFFGRLVIQISEYFVERMPIIRTIYSAIKQIFETIMATQSQAFREVVMLEYPRKGVWSIGFVTGRSEGEIQRLTENETINVFVPTTPNPTSGFLLFVAKEELKYMDMTVEEGVKLVVSAGMIIPPDAKLVSTQKTAKVKTQKKTTASKKAAVLKKSVKPKKKSV